MATRVPFDPAVTRAMVERQAVTEVDPGPAAAALAELHELLKAAVADLRDRSPGE